MFDSENIPLVTRVEAGPGIIVSYVRNSDYEGVWTATIDSDYVTEIIEKSSRLSDSDLIDIAFLRETIQPRVIELENLLGVQTQQQASTQVVVPEEDSDVFRDIVYNQPVTNLTSEMKVRWSVISFDGSAIISRDVVFATGSTKRNVLNALMYSMKSNTQASKYISTIRFDDVDKIHFAWYSAYTNFSLKIEVLQNVDNASFTINQ